jgi:hypothetical protein
MTITQRLLFIKLFLPFCLFAQEQLPKNKKYSTQKVYSLGISPGLFILNQDLFDKCTYIAISGNIHTTNGLIHSCKFTNVSFPYPKAYMSGHFRSRTIQISSSKFIDKKRNASILCSIGYSFNSENGELTEEFNFGDQIDPNTGFVYPTNSLQDLETNDNYKSQNSLIELGLNYTFKIDSFWLRPSIYYTSYAELEPTKFMGHPFNLSGLKFSLEVLYQFTTTN